MEWVVWILLMDEHLKAAQQDVNRLMGCCVLRLQQYESQLKSILAHHDVSWELRSTGAMRTSGLPETSRQTLGNLIKAFIGSVLVSGEPDAIDEGEGEEEKGDDDKGPPRFHLKMRLGMAEEDYARTEMELRELVLLRNELIHHFMEQHDLWTLAGCRVAQNDLMAACDRIGTHLTRLRDWADDLDRAMQEARKAARSEAFLETVVNGILPDGTVFWPAAGIVLALRRAAQTLAVQGWTEISAAARWIAEHDPNQTPEKYGCRTMRQVVHQSGEFELRVFEKNGIRQCHYRLRDGQETRNAGNSSQIEVLFE